MPSRKIVVLTDAGLAEGWTAMHCGGFVLNPTVSRYASRAHYQPASMKEIDKAVNEGLMEWISVPYAKM